MSKTKLETWQDDLHALNEERSQVVYRLMDEAGHDPGDWQAAAMVQASAHPDLVDVNNRIQEHLDNHPVGLAAQRVDDMRRDYEELVEQERRHNDPNDPLQMTPDQQAALDRYRMFKDMGEK
jgi:hypothetical protein